MGSLRKMLANSAPQETESFAGAPESILDQDLSTDLTEFVAHLCALKRPFNLRDIIDDIERAIICQILAEVQGNQRAAARLLGFKHTTLNEKVKRYGIQFRKYPFSLR